MQETRVKIIDVFNIKGVGVVPIGQVLSGDLKIGMKMNLNGKVMTINMIEKAHKKVETASQGEKAGFSLDNGDYKALKLMINQEVTFTDKGGAGSFQQITNNPRHPETFFDTIKNLFRRN